MSDKEKEEQEEKKEPETEKEAGKKDEEPSEKKAPSEEEKLKQQISILNAELEKAKQEAETWKNKYYMAYADMSNLRKSVEKDHETFLKYRASGFLDKIMPALDSFDMAAASKPSDPTVQKFQEGYKMIHRQLLDGLRSEGVSFIEPKTGEAFDANVMHAVQTVEGEEDGKVAAVYTKGYRLHDRLIRPAMVVVTRKAEEKKEEAPKPKGDGVSDKK